VGSPSVGIRFDTQQFDTQFLKRHSIKVVIQESPGGRYWECRGRWTSDLQAATSFSSCTAALEHATHLSLSDAQLVLTHESKACGVIPLKAGARG
jgi:hypothetical protein